MIDECVPVASRDAGSNAILSHIAALMRAGYEVSFVPVDMIGPEPDAPDHPGLTLCHAPWFASVEEVLRRQAGRFDLVYLHRVTVAASHAALVRRYQPKARLVFNVADLQHLRLQRQSAVEQRPELMAAARSARAQEIATAHAADVVLTHSVAEANWLARDVPAGRVHVVIWDVPVAPTSVPFAARSGVAFIGGYQHRPSVDAAFRLVEEIMPLVWSRDPSIACLLVGSDMPEAVRALAGPKVEVLGQVEDLATVFDRVRLTVAPLAYGAGIKGKVLVSMAAGVPCACSPVAAEGIVLAELAELVGGDAAALADIILRLYGDAGFNAASATMGLRYVADRLSAARLDVDMGAALGLD